MKILNLLLLLTSVVYALNDVPLVKINTWQDEKTNIPVYFVARHESPMLDLAVVYDAGLSRIKHQEIAVITNNLLLRGVKGYDYKALREAFDSTGSIITNSVDQDSSLIYLRTLIDEPKLKKSLFLLKRIVSSPTFKQKQIKIVKQLAEVSLLQNENNPYYLANKKLLQLIYGNHSYGYKVSLHGYKNIKRKELANFFKNYYTRKGAKIIMVGDISLVKAKSIASDLAKNILPGKKLKHIQKTKGKLTASNIKIDFDTKQSTVLLGHAAVDSEFDNMAILDLGNYILGTGMDSDLFVEIREKRGWAYFVNSSFFAGKYGGHFVIATQTQNKSIEKITAKIKQVVDNFLTKGPSDVQLQRAKSKLIRQTYESLSTNSALLNIVTEIAVNNRPVNYIDMYISQIEAAKIKSVQSVMKKVLRKMNTVVVGPKDIQPFKLVHKKEKL